MLNAKRLNYYRRIFAAYLTAQKSQLTFWHEVPKVNENFSAGALGEYYMPFIAKADYRGQLDATGIPQLDYHGSVGLQYNPIAIAQYGLGNYNLYLRTGETARRARFIAVADWLATNLEQNAAGLWVWQHHFDWDYRTTLKAPWYSGLAQGQGISVLVRAHRETGNNAYLAAASRAFEALTKSIDAGGVIYTDARGHLWIEEYIVAPEAPTHILNGFIWAAWGVYDYLLATGDERAAELFERSIETISHNLPDYDTGYWSLYEQSGTRLKMMASPFYHHLHIVQLQILFRLTGRESFRQYAARWDNYRHSRPKRAGALLYKSVFKLCYY